MGGIEGPASYHSGKERTGRSSSHGEREKCRHSVVGSGRSLGTVVAAVLVHLERELPCHSSRRDHLDNHVHDTHSAHSFLRCAGNQAQRQSGVGWRENNLEAS